MPLEPLRGIVAQKMLSAGNIAAIRHLAAVCESHEYTRLRISWGMLQTRPGDFPLDFLYYDNGKLIGYLALDNRGVEAKELFGMVHPAYRRQGIFQLLFQAAKDVCRSRAVKRLVLTCERASPSGQAFVRSVGAAYDFSEHEMVLIDFCPRLQFDDRLSVRLANAEDIDALTFVQAAAFDDSEAVVRRRITMFMANSLCRYYLLQLFSYTRPLHRGEKLLSPTVPPDINSSRGTMRKKSNVFTPGGETVAYGEPVGSLRLELDEEIGIYAFGIHPTYQRCGYGRQMLEEVIYRIGADQHTGQKAVVLDVETDNVHALSLYRSCGFQIRATYDYYNSYVKS